MSFVPYVVEQSAHGERSYDIFSRLLNDRIIVLSELIGGQGGGLSGQTTDIKIHAEHMVYIRDKMNRMLSEYTGQPLEKIQQDTERDNYLTAQQAKEYGLIDEVIAHR